MCLCVSEKEKEEGRKRGREGGKEEGRNEGRKQGPNMFVGYRICKRWHIWGQVIHCVWACCRWWSILCFVGCLAAFMAAVCWISVASRQDASIVALPCDNQKCLHTLPNTLGKEANYSRMRTNGLEEKAVEKVAHVRERREK